MNNTFLPEYYERKKEVDYFLNILKEFQNFDMMSDDKNQLINFEFNIFNFSDFFKIIRSNFILILYNFIESSITLFIREIYTKFEFEDISYAEASECFKNLYLEHLFSDTFQEEANFKTYKNKAIEMVRNTLDNICLNFSINKIPSLSGNVSSKLIQKIWKECVKCLPACRTGLKKPWRMLLTNLLERRLPEL